MEKSTFHGKIWWGDRVGKRDLNGINPKFKNNIDFTKFFKKDILSLQYFLSPVFKQYNYEKIINENDKFRIIYLMPFKFDFIIFFSNLKHLRFLNAIMACYYFIKRLILFKKINLKDLPKKI